MPGDPRDVETGREHGEGPPERAEGSNSAPESSKLPIPECCGTCRFWSAYGSGEIALPIGDCLRFPRAERKLSNEWCGEYQRGDGAAPQIDAEAEGDEAYRARLRLAIGPHSVHTKAVEMAQGDALDRLGTFVDLPRR